VGAAVVSDISNDGRGGHGGGSSGGSFVDSGGGSSVNGSSVDDDVSDNSSYSGGDGCGGGAETVMTAAATAGVKIQQSMQVGGWTRARQRVVMNNKSVWPMMRAVTKRAARERATAYPRNIELGIDCQILK